MITPYLIELNSPAPTLLQATDSVSSAAQLTFTVNNVTHGRFEFMAAPGISITQFTQQNINNGAVCFVHDGGTIAPSYQIRVTDGALTTIAPAVEITFNCPPVLTVNQLHLNQSDIITLSPDMLSASDVESSPDQLTFTVSNLTHGQFEVSDSPGIAITQFTQQQLNEGLVRFIHDGSTVAPSYAISVSDGAASLAPSPATVVFNQAPILLANQLNITQGETLILTSAMLNGSDAENSPDQLIFTVSEVMHGYFALISTPRTAITQFTQQQLNEGLIHFVHDDSTQAPSYHVSVSDGQVATTHMPATIRFNALPILVTNQLSIGQATTVTLSPIELSATDDISSAEQLTFNASHVTHGHFEFIDAPGTAITQFTQQQVNQSQVGFVHDGSMQAPSYEISVSDGELSTAAVSAIIAFNQCPVLLHHQVSLKDGDTVTLTSESLSVSDDRTPAPSLNFRLNSVQQGRFSMLTNTSVTLTQFTQSQVQAGQVCFIHNSSNLAPSWDVSVSDGILTTLPSPMTIQFNQRPVWRNRQLTLSEGEYVVVSDETVSVVDDAKPEDLLFTVTTSEHGQFASTSQPKQALTAFTAQHILSRNITFSHDGGETPPTVRLTVTDGVFTLDAVNMFIAYTPINDAPYWAQPILPQIYAAGEIINFAVPADTFVDPEGKQLTWSATATGNLTLPSGLQFDSPSHVFTGQLSQVTNWNISLQAWDPEGLKATAFFTLQIAEALTVQNPCKLPGLSAYSSDDVTCTATRSVIIGLPSTVGTLCLALLGYWLKKRSVEKSWAEPCYRVHNYVRHALQLAIGVLEQERDYEDTIYDLVGRICNQAYEEKERDAAYRIRVGKKISEWSQEKIEQHGEALTAAIREHIHFPKLYCDGGAEDKRPMPIYRYFYIIPNPLSCLTTYSFKSRIVAERFDKIVASTQAILLEQKTISAPVRTGERTGCCATAAGLFCCKKRQVSPMSKAHVHASPTSTSSTSTFV